MGVDQVIREFDVALRSVAGTTQALRSLPHPAQGEVGAGAVLDEAERHHSAGYMRVNHVGEVCAQALYQAQALATRNESLEAEFRRAALEEQDHLAWTAHRLEDLNARPSVLNPFWYAGAFALGLLAGKLGDRVSLGFMAETERQVEQHLQGHLDTLPANDAESRAIVQQMKIDEAQHAANAEASGALAMPLPVRLAMRAMAKVMTVTAYRI